MRNSKKSDISVSPLKYFQENSRDLKHLFSDKKTCYRAHQGSPYTKGQLNPSVKCQIQNEFFKERSQPVPIPQRDLLIPTTSRACSPLIQKHFTQMSIHEDKKLQNRIKHFQKLDGQSQPQNYCRSKDRVQKLLNKQSYSQCYVSKEKSQCSSASTANTMMITDFKKDDSIDIQMTTRNSQRLIGKRKRNHQSDQLIQQDTLKQQKIQASQEKHSQDNFCSQLDQTACWGSPGSIMDIKDSQENSKEPQKSSIIAIPTTRAHTQSIQKSTLTRSTALACTKRDTPNRNRSTKLGRNPGSVKKLEQEAAKIQEKPRLPFAVLNLINKKDGSRHRYKVYEDKDLAFLRSTTSKKKLILDFNMKNLELEYDYDTDEEQILAARQMLSRENIDAVDYFVKEDPLILVGNLNTE